MMHCSYNILTQNGDDGCSRTDFLSLLIDSWIHEYINLFGEKKLSKKYCLFKTVSTGGKKLCFRVIYFSVDTYIPTSESCDIHFG